MNKITGSEVQGMVEHWLNTPTCGYLGSDYGQDAKALLQLPQSDGAADDFLRKLRDDVQILQAYPPGSLNIYGVHSGADRLDLFIEVAGPAISVPGVK